MKIKTIPKNYTQKDGTVWEWVETPSLREYIQQEQSKIAQVSLNDKSK